jgi:serine/threonine protein kinase
MSASGGSSKGSARYEKGVVLGQGTFGSVYKAIDKQVGSSDPLQHGGAWASMQGVRLGSIAPTRCLVQSPPNTIPCTSVACRIPLQTGKVVAVKNINVGASKQVRVLGTWQAQRRLILSQLAPSPAT